MVHAAKPRLSSTVLLVRQLEKTFDLFMVRRGSRGFMAGAFVFPGGKLDGADLQPELMARCDLCVAEAARRLSLPGDAEEALGLHVAALRELFEEAGVLLAVHPSGHLVDSTSEPLPGYRRALLAEEMSFQEILHRLDLTLAASSLHYFAHWITPPVEPRRFDTRFFIARAPAKAMANHDARETIDSRWLEPGEALGMGAKGEINLPPPTAKSLELLAAQPDVDRLLKWAQQWTPVTVCPEVEMNEDGQIFVILPGAPGSSLPSSVYPGPRRYQLTQDGFWVPA